MGARGVAVLVKLFETRAYEAIWAAPSDSVSGGLIQATVGSFGGSG